MSNSVEKIQKLTEEINSFSDSIERLREERHKKLEALLPLVAKFPVGANVRYDKDVMKVVNRVIWWDSASSTYRINYEVRKFRKTGELAALIKRVDWHEADKWEMAYGVEEAAQVWKYKDDNASREF